MMGVGNRDEFRGEEGSVPVSFPTGDKWFPNGGDFGSKERGG